MAKGPEFREANAARHRARMEQLSKSSARYNGNGEPNVVPGYQLAAVLQDWCRRWLLDRPKGALHGSIGGHEFVGPVQYLAEESGIPIRRVSGYCNNEWPTVGESKAERLLMAIDREYMLVTGEIQVVPNPNWSLEKWMAWREEQGCI